MRSPFVKQPSVHPLRPDRGFERATRALSRTSGWIAVVSLAGVALGQQAAPITVPASAAAASVGGSQSALGPCAPGGAVQTLTATSCWPADCTSKAPVPWTGIPLAVPKFDPTLGSLVGVRLHFEAEYEALECYDNLTSDCCGASSVVDAIFHLAPGANVPALGEPAPFSVDVSVNYGGILLGPTDGVLDCLQGPSGPPADGTCSGGDAITLAASGTASHPGIQILDPTELAKWVAGSGNPMVEFSSASLASATLTAFCAQIQSTTSFDALVRLTVTYEYCAPSVGLAFCFGDGSGSLCPCGNPGAPGAGCANSSGGGATLVAFGSADVALDDLRVGAAGLLPARPVLLLCGLNAVNGGQGIPFGDGLRCAGGMLVRLGVRVPDGAGVASWGPGLAAAGGWAPGDVRRLQAWYRDVAGSPCGSAFNLTHGVEVAFY